MENTQIYPEMLTQYFSNQKAYSERLIVPPGAQTLEKPGTQSPGRSHFNVP